MPKTQFRRSQDFSQDRERAWQLVTDIRTVAGWISVCRDIQEVVPLGSYTAVLEDKIGLFAMRADLDIQVVDVAPLEYLRVRADGQDRQIGARLAVEGQLSLDARESQTVVTVEGWYEVTGRAAQLGANTIKRKADKILDQFFLNLEAAARSGEQNVTSG
jgi:uncharacterized protein